MGLFRFLGESFGLLPKGDGLPVDFPPLENLRGCQVKATFAGGEQVTGSIADATHELTEVTCFVNNEFLEHGDVTFFDLHLDRGWWDVYENDLVVVTLSLFGYDTYVFYGLPDISP